MQKCDKITRSKVFQPDSFLESDSRLSTLVKPVEQLVEAAQNIKMRAETSVGKVVLVKDYIKETAVLQRI